MQLINELSFVQTYYPKVKLTKYLNYLSTQIYQKVYKTKSYYTKINLRIYLSILKKLLICVFQSRWT